MHAFLLVPFEKSGANDMPYEALDVRIQQNEDMFTIIGAHFSMKTKAIRSEDFGKDTEQKPAIWEEKKHGCFCIQVAKQRTIPKALQKKKCTELKRKRNRF